MSAQSNIARPYAQALFELAQEQKDLAGWAEQLQLLAAVASDASVIDLTRNPRISSARLAALLIDVCGDKLNDGGKNLVKLLARNGRVKALGDIVQAYAAHKAEAEKVVAANMVTAVPINKRQQKQFAEVLQSRLGRSVNLEFEVDEELIGGAVIRAGDWVVDGSVKAQLEQLVGALNT